MRIRLAIPDRHVTAPILDAALEATTRAAEVQQLAGEGPTFSELLRMGVRWRPENFADGEHFDLPAVIGQRGWADCDDLAPCLAAELRRQDPGAVARVVRSGPDRWHAIVQTSDGQILDPSAMAGMRTGKGVHGAIARPMTTVGSNAIAIAPYQGEAWVRTDVPWADGHLASTAHDRSVMRALDRSIAGAMCAGVGVGWPHAFNRAVVGDIWGSIADAFGGSGAEYDQMQTLIAAANQAQADARANRPGNHQAQMPGTVTPPPAPTGPSPPPATTQVQWITLPTGVTLTYTPGGPLMIRF